MSVETLKSVLPLSIIILVTCGPPLNRVQAQETNSAKPTNVGQTIDLPTTLRLAGANNLDLAIVKQALVQAEAQNDAATLSFFPWLSGGFGYDKHDGAKQDSSGNVIRTFDQLHTKEAAINAQVDLGNAIFQKLAASRLQSAAEYAVDAQHNNTVSLAASGYFDLVSAVANVNIAEDAVRISRDYEDQVNRAVSIGLINKIDGLQVGVQTQGYQVLLRQAQEAEKIAESRLATVLHLNPAIELQPKDQLVPQVALIPQSAKLDYLLAEAADNRPELKESAATVEAADWQRKQSIYGPLIPSVSAQSLYGSIQGGPRGLPPNSGGSQDIAVMFNWRVGPGGLLDFSRMDYAESKLEQNQLADARLHDQVTQQVVQSFEAVNSAKDQIDLTKEAVALAEQNLKLSQDRRQFGVANVLEVIQAQKDVVQARISFVHALDQYAKSEYALAQAVGQIGQ
jgi:outer membrane protein TolC